MSDTASNAIAKRRSDILGQLAQMGNPPATLVAVSKRQPDERIDAALCAGQRVFGENRVQEAAARWRMRRDTWPGLELRLIGPLQTNKAEDAVALFDVIETLDRPKLARALAAAMNRLGRHLPCLIQVNTGDEAQKAGVGVGEIDSLLKMARDECGLDVRGLMCIPPVSEPAGPHFALLARLAGERGLDIVSMGMSADYLLAAELGASHVRIGSALFGERED